jgi:cation diffusion facilitator family transporter
LPGDDPDGKDVIFLLERRDSILATSREKINSLKETKYAMTATAVLKSAADREKQVIKTSVTGILANVLLAVFKAVVGFLTGSIAIVLDAVNNISDAASSVITIVGTKLAAKEADKKHPFGYGRMEYLTAMIISLIVLYAGVTSLEQSIKKILNPSVPKYTAVSLIIVAAGVLVKIVLGRYVKGQGLKLKSDSLINSGQDAILDSVISASTLIAAVIFILTGVSLEAWLGAVIAIGIIKSGIDMLRGTLSEILGERIDTQLAKDIKKTVTSFPDVSGAYDLVLNNYGPDAYNGSIHIEVPDTYSADELDQLIREISVKVFAEHNVILTAVGVYSVNTHDPRAIEARAKISKIVLGTPGVLQMHGFYLDEKHQTIRFDVVVSFDAEDRNAVFRQVLDQVQKAYPDFLIDAAIDTDFSET